jgi:citrate lyase subunit beta / citryl-CoA lyase
MRTYLYVPADQPDKLSKALDAGADAIIIDLEDSIAPLEKFSARGALSTFLMVLKSTSRPVIPNIWVRINVGEMGNDDAQAAMRAGRDLITGIVVPKVSSVEQVESADRALSNAEFSASVPKGSVAICALIETAEGVLNARSIAGGPRVQRLALGEVDLGSELGIDPSPDDRELMLSRQMVVLASSAAGLEAPIGSVSIDVRDAEALRSSSQALLRMGFGGRAAIHPAQVPVINEVFTPSAHYVKRAEEIVAVFEASIARGEGVCTDDSGRMIDEAVVRGARRVLARANGVR